MENIIDNTCKLKYLHLYLAETTIKVGSSLNVMFAIKNNNDEDCVVPLRIYVCPSERTRDNDWQLGAQKHFKLEAKKIHHVYMNIPKEAFSPASWGDKTYDEFIISCANSAPTDEIEQRKTTDIVFIAQES